MRRDVCAMATTTDLIAPRIQLGCHRAVPESQDWRRGSGEEPE